MKKKLSLFFALVMFVSCLGFNVSAKQSIMVNGAVDGEVTKDGKIVEGSKGVFSDDFNDVPSDVQDQIAKLNEGTSISEVLDTSKIDTKLDLSKYALLTKVQDLKAYDANGNQITENVGVTWEVPNLTESMDVQVLHYSTVRNVWEIITPDKIDLENTKITTTFKDLSPVAVIYAQKDTSGTTKTEEKTNTGAQTNTAVYAGIGVVAVLAGAFFVVKSKKSNN